MDAFLKQIKIAAVDGIVKLLESVQQMVKSDKIIALTMIIDYLTIQQQYEECTVVYLELLNVSTSYLHWIDYLNHLKLFSTILDVSAAFELGVKSCDMPDALYEPYFRALRLHGEFEELEKVNAAYQAKLSETQGRKRKFEADHDLGKKVFEKQSNLNKTLVVKNYNLQEQEELEFQTYFERFGKIVHLSKHDNETVFIEFVENKSVGLCRESKHQFKDVQLYVQIPVGARDRTLYISGLSTSTTDAELKQYLSQFGTVEDIRMKTNFETSSAFAYVDMFSAIEAKNACYRQSVEIDGKKVHITLSNPKKARNNQQIRTDQSRSCCIKNLPFWLEPSKKEPLEKILEPFGKVLEIRFLNNHKGMVFVEFDKVEEAEGLIKSKDVLKLGGRVLRIEAVTK